MAKIVTSDVLNQNNTNIKNYIDGQSYLDTTEVDFVEAEEVTTAETIEVDFVSVDSTPTQNSTNLVTSGGVHSAIQSVDSKISTFLGTNSDTLSGIKDLIAQAEESGEIAVLENTIGGKQDKITTSNKLDYSLIDGTPTIPSAVTETTVSGWGFTKNVGDLKKTDADGYYQPKGSYVTTSDSRLTDSRTPKAHTHTTSDITNFPSIPDETAIANMGFTKNEGTVKSINKVEPNASGNVLIPIPSAVYDSTVADWGYLKKNGDSYSFSCSNSVSNATYYQLMYTQGDVQAWENTRYVFFVSSRHCGNGLVTISYGCNNGTVSASNIYAEVKYFGTSASAGSAIYENGWLVFRDGNKIRVFLHIQDWDNPKITLVGRYSNKTFPTHTFGSKGEAISSSWANTNPWGSYTEIARNNT